MGIANVVATDTKFLSYLKLNATAKNIRCWIENSHYYYYSVFLLSDTRYSSENIQN